MQHAVDGEYEGGVGLEISADNPLARVRSIIWRDEAARDGLRVVPKETPIALTYNRSTHAVMLASPADLADFAIGFSLSESIIECAADVMALEIVEVADGIECRMDLATDRLEALTTRQRRMAGPSGCGLCGLDSLAAAVRRVPSVPVGRVYAPAMVHHAMRLMTSAQVLNAATHAVHAAAFWTPESGLVALREDVGRHNALDKLSGALVRQRLTAVDGVVLLSSRVSVEMVQKAAMLGAPVVVAISAPTSLAIDAANEVGITLIGIARTDGFEIFTHQHRIGPGVVRCVAPNDTQRSY